MLVLVIGDIHLPTRCSNLHAKFRKLLVPNKMQHVLCTGNLTNRDTFDFLKSLASDVHVVKGDYDDTAATYPESKIITVGSFKIGLIHGHQIVPWGDERAIEMTARQMSVDVLISGHTHQCKVYEKEGVFYVNPGSATGAFSTITENPEPSFALMDVQSSTIVTYLYRIVEDDVKVERVTFTKPNAA
ncbi:hypothetical protein L596_018799 [Steinernema carpocapsae]|nr:hypothetical protein L596_018799 [Steinernema carpocapsae]